MKKTAYCAFLGLIITISIHAPVLAHKTDLKTDSLLKQWNIMLNSLSDSLQMAASQKVKAIFHEYFNTTQDLHIDIPKEIKLSLLAPSDSTFIILTWNIALSSQGYYYDGLIVAKNKTDSNLSIFPLTDKSEEMRNPEMSITNPDNWYGALYYQLAEFKTGKDKFYVLLGWDGGNGIIQRKLIEILHFNKDYSPQFGSKILNQSPKTRIIFEYASGSYFALRYEKQYYRKRVWYKRKPVTERASMIVMNRLIYEPMVGANVAVGNILDAYLYADGKLVLIKDIDARNPSEKNRSSGKNPPQQGLLPSDEESNKKPSENF